ncbi:MAG: SDR family oxidoreductase [Thermoanaerobaculaceae bacterium]
MDLGLADVSVLVGGGSSGLGFACAKTFLGEGAKVTVVARGGERLEQAKAYFEQLAPGRVLAVAADLSQRGGARKAYRAAADCFGPPLVIVANGGGPPPMPAREAGEEAFVKAQELLLRPVVEWVQEALPAMRAARWGRFIAITSVSARQPEKDLVLSSSFRAAILAYLKTLAREESGYGVTFNAVCPGFTATQRLEALAQRLSAQEGLSPQEVMARWAQAAPVGRLGEPEELAAAVVFLASRQAGFINGVALAVDGGYSLGLL